MGRLCDKSETSAPSSLKNHLDTGRPHCPFPMDRQTDVPSPGLRGMSESDTLPELSEASVETLGIKGTEKKKKEKQNNYLVSGTLGDS